MANEDRWRMEPACRINLRATFGGVMTVLALMLLGLTLGGALRVWNLRFGDIGDAGWGFWAWATATWMTSVFFGARLAVTASRARIARDGVVQAVTVWAASSVLLTAALALFTGRLIDFSEARSTAPVWIAFVGNVLALAGAFRAAAMETAGEDRARRQELRVQERLEIIEGRRTAS